MARNDQTGQRNWRSDQDRNTRSREQNEGRHGGSEDDRDRDYDYRYTRDDEGDSSVRAGSYDQGRAQYGSGRDRDEQQRRDTNEQSGSTGRYSGYGDFGQGDYGGGRGGWSGQERYGQSGFGRGGYGQGQSGQYRGGNFAGDQGGSSFTRQGGYGGDYGQGRYGQGGSRSRFESGSDDYGYGGAHRSQGSSAWRGHGVEGDYGSGPGANDPAGEGQQQFGSGGGSSGGSLRGTGQHRGKGPKGYQRSDDRLKEMICERLREDPHIDASEVTVNVQNSRVTLEGTVDSRHAKNMIEDIAEQLGIDDVQNNLRVQRQTLGGVGGQGSSQSGGQAGMQGTGSGENRGTSSDQTKLKQH